MREHVHRDTREMKYSVILTNISSREEAESLARRLVEARVVACVNIIPGVLSFYEWKGKIESEEEFTMLCKTSSGRARPAMRMIEELHPYDVPEVIELGIESGSSGYLGWIDEVVSGEPENDSCE